MTSSRNPYTVVAGGARLPPVALLAPRLSRPCTRRETVPVSALMYLAGGGRRPARREGVTPGVYRGPTGLRAGRAHVQRHTSLSRALATAPADRVSTLATSRG